MSKTKKVTITLTEEQQIKARNLSVLILGKENISGLIGYMINKLHKETEKQHFLQRFGYGLIIYVLKKQNL